MEVTLEIWLVIGHVWNAFWCLVVSLWILHMPLGLCGIDGFAQVPKHKMSVHNSLLLWGSALPYSSASNFSLSAVLLESGGMKSVEGYSLIWAGKIPAIQNVVLWSQLVKFLYCLLQEEAHPLVPAVVTGSLKRGYKHFL